MSHQSAAFMVPMTLTVNGGIPRGTKVSRDYISVVGDSWGFGSGMGQSSPGSTLSGSPL
jgi:hypothetical protein